MTFDRPINDGYVSLDRENHRVFSAEQSPIRTNYVSIDKDGKLTPVFATSDRFICGPREDVDDQRPTRRPVPRREDDDEDREDAPPPAAPRFG